MACSLYGGVIVDDIDLTDIIWELIPIEGLALFSGGTEE